ncbi:hypothetical protein CRE_27416 [Caenorhabditis remanei]|uniref:Uncharacterized protein n=1 Tax=Caenorhabditis remanei TaxID=31234 RepID=E3LNH8_CAERE|nr:hypothetical protein CRE_27416 [Caenorhabditis remanei]
MAYSNLPTVNNLFQRVPHNPVYSYYILPLSMWISDWTIVIYEAFNTLTILPNYIHASLWVLISKPGEA